MHFFFCFWMGLHIRPEWGNNLQTLFQTAGKQRGEDIGDKTLAGLNSGPLGTHEQT